MDIKDLIHESNLIEGFDNPYADRLGYYAWKKLIKSPVLGHDLIRKTQKQVTLHQSDMLPHWRGYYRDLSMVEVKVGGRAGLQAKLVKGAMTEWLANLDAVTPKQAHVIFEHIHPFVDGNGRTGRLLMWWMEYKDERPLSVITYADRAKYYAWF